MDEKIIEISFNIIGYAGEGKGLAFEAIKEAKNGNIEKAKELLKESREVINKAHRYQTELIQNEASGNRTEISVILIHAHNSLNEWHEFSTVS